MSFLKTLGLTISLLYTANIWADTIKIKPDHPNRYVVVKNDNLWDISSKFLVKPWKWPQLWNNTPEIKNPHLIYPGDIINFYLRNGQPQLSLEFTDALSSDVRLGPRIRESVLDEAIKAIPTDAIAQFLTSPKVVDKDELEQSPYVIDFAGEHLIAGAGDRIYVRSIEEPKSLGYTIYRAGDPYVRPETREILGYEAIYIADTTIERAGDPATLMVTTSEKEIRKGDRLMVSPDGELALNFFPRAPENFVKGNIISVLDGVTQIGQYSVVVIDKGIVDGMEPGHVLDIYHKGKVVNDPFSNEKKATVKLPDELAGLLLVFRPFDQVSYALVLEANQAIHVLDGIESPM
ncbi:MAG: LysM peptidoglycan-binding domain-containing protein [Methylococcales bacterium]|nr:LysM peptidoglycan-binding domain-containing protein [Methylococcales bacterium]